MKPEREALSRSLLPCGQGPEYTVPRKALPSLDRSCTGERRYLAQDGWDPTPTPGDRWKRAAAWIGGEGQGFQKAPGGVALEAGQGSESKDRTREGFRTGQNSGGPGIPGEEQGPRHRPVSKHSGHSSLSTCRKQALCTALNRPHLD